MIKGELIVNERYRFLSKETQEKGLYELNLDRNDYYYNRENNIFFLKKRVSVPTGLAFGYPLDKFIAERIFILLQTIDNKIQELSRLNKSIIAFVKPAKYHITLLNYSHYDHSQKIEYLSENEKIIISKEIKKLNEKPITISFKGMILTPMGKLIIPGYSSSNQIYKLRNNFSKINTKFRITIPDTNHIKIGHVISQISNRETLHQILNIINLYNENINFSQQFTDLYTPCGRIKF